MLMTLKRVHAWTGFWGAALFLLLGTSGVLLNHRSVLPIDVGGSVEVSTILLSVKPGIITTEAALGSWAQHELRLSTPPRAPAPDPKAAKPLRFLGRDMVAAASWSRIFYLPNQKVTVDYIPGSTGVSAKVETLGVLAIIKNLHKGTGLGVMWVLFIDTIAGALVAMSITGFLLWSRLHGPRLLAGALASGAIGWALIGSLPLFG